MEMPHPKSPAARRGSASPGKDDQSPLSWTDAPAVALHRALDSLASAWPLSPASRSSTKRGTSGSSVAVSARPSQGSNGRSSRVSTREADPGSPIEELRKARTRARLAYENDVEAQLSNKTPKSTRSTRSVVFALPQLINGRCVWPEHWGITRLQIKELLTTLRQQEDWSSENSVYTLVSSYIIPWTQGMGISYALLVNGKEPKEVNLMVSHAWGENAEDFLEALLRSTHDDDVLFICALSLYQAEDAAGPSIAEQVGTKLSESPFRRVLKHIQARGREAGWRWRWRNWLDMLPKFCLLMSILTIYLPMLMWGCVPTLDYCVEQRRKHDIDEDGDVMSDLAIWASGLGGHHGWTWQRQGPWFRSFTVTAVLSLLCTFSCWALRRWSKAYAGRMVVVPNREVDIYTRLWCVYEIWVAKSLGIGVEVAHTLASAGRARSRSAQCGLPDDTERIVKEIEAHGPNTYEQIDKAVFVTTRGSRWQAAKVSIFYGFLIAVFVVAFLRIRGSTKDVVAMVNGIMLACILIVCAVYSTFRCAQGTPTASAVLVCSCSLLALGSSLELLLMQLPYEFWFYHFIEHLSRTLLAGGIYVALFVLAALLRCHPARTGTGGSLPVVSLLSAVAFAVLTGLEVASTGFESLFPSAVSNASFVCGYLFAPVFLGWSAAARWGVRIHLQASLGPCRSGL